MWVCDDYKTLNQALSCSPVLVAAMLGGGRLQSSTSVGSLCTGYTMVAPWQPQVQAVVVGGHYDYHSIFMYSFIVLLNTLRLRQTGRHFADAIFKCFFLNENVWIPIKISLKFVSKGPINNISALVQIMAWHRPGQPLSEPMMVSLLTHICVTIYISFGNITLNTLQYITYSYLLMINISLLAVNYLRQSEAYMH